MPYEPNQVTEYDRSRAYRYMLAAAAASLVNLANAFLGYDNILFAVIFGLTVGGLLIAVLPRNTDEFMRSMIEVGMRAAFGVLAAYLTIAFIVNIADVAHSAGYAAATGEMASSNGRAALFFTDAQTLASLLAAAFYAGFGLAWLRNRFGS